MREDAIRQKITESSDAELCRLIRQHAVDDGSNTSHPLVAEAFGELYSRHREAAMSNAYRMLGNRDAAEDAVAEAFSKCLGALRRGLGPSDSFLGYLMVAVRTEALRGSRVERSTESTAPELLFESPELVARLITEDHATSLSERDQLVRAFTGLPENWQQVLLLVEVDDLSMAEAAARIGMTIAATNSLAGRAREGLRAAYLQQYAAVAAPECAGSAAQLARLVRGGLSSKPLRMARNHVAECPACSEQMARLARINEQLKTVLGPTAAVGSGIGAGAAVASGAEQGTRAATAWKTGVAAAVAVAAGVTMFAMWPRPVEPVTVPKPISKVSQPTPAAQPDPQMAPAATEAPAPEPQPVTQEPQAEATLLPAPSEEDASANWVLVE